MLKIGFIGSVGSIVSHIRNLRKIKGVQIIGKSSVGMMDQPEGKTLSIPEYKRMDLIDAADILIVDRSSLLHPDLLKIAVKSNKHLYITDFPDISAGLCFELLKLADEAKTVVKIRNPLLSEPLTNWIAENWQEPAYISFFESVPELPDKKSFLIKYLYYSLSLFNAVPQKIRVCGIPHSGKGTCFINLRLDYTTYSAVNIELLVLPAISRNLKVAMPGKFLEGNCISGKAHFNQQELTVGMPGEKGLIEFVNQTGNENFYLNSDLNSYHSTLLTLNEALGKIELYTPWQ